MVCAAFLPSPRALGCAIIRVCLRLSRRLLRPPSARNAFPELRGDFVNAIAEEAYAMALWQDE